MTTENVVKSRNGLAIASMILGILALLIAVFLMGNMIAALCGIAAIITGAIALKQVKEQGSQGKGLAIAGIVLGALSLVWAFIIVPVVLGPMIADVFNKINSAMNP